MGFPDVIESREVLSSLGAPSIDRVRDAGSVRVPIAGPWKGEPDGVAVPGEVVLIEGSNFGKQPTVQIGGRACSILARTEGGGVVTRVPTGVIAGVTPVSVSSPKGRAEAKLTVKRFAVVAFADKVWTLEVGKEAKLVAAPLAVPGTKKLRLSGDGSAAYVLASRPQGDVIVAIDLAAPGGPRIAATKKLAHRATLLAAAEDAPSLVAIGDGKVSQFSLGQPRMPAPWDPVELPKEQSKPLAAELSPDGNVLALLFADGNKLSVLEQEKAPGWKFVTTVDLLPQERLPLVRDLAFSSDGETLWVVSGDNEKSLPAVQPTRLSAVRLLVGNEAPPTAGGEGATTPPAAPPKHGARLLSLWRTQSVPGAAAPLHVAVARGQPLASGTTIRMPPEKAAVFVTSLNDALFKLGELKLDTLEGAKESVKLMRGPNPGILVRADVAGGGGPLFTAPQILSAIDITPDAQLIATTAARVAAPSSGEGVVLEFGVDWAPIWGTPSPTFVSLAPLAAQALKPPFSLGDLRIQP